MTEQFKVGEIRSVHGVHGEAKVFVTADNPKRFTEIKQVYVKGKGPEQILKIESVKFFRDMVILKFFGVDTPEEIRQYRGSGLYIDRKDAVPCKKDEFYVADLIVLSVKTDDGQELGIAADLYPTAGSHILVVKTREGKEILIPYVNEFVAEVNPAGGYITVHLMDGLV